MTTEIAKQKKAEAAQTEKYETLSRLIRTQRGKDDETTTSVSLYAGEPLKMEDCAADFTRLSQCFKTSQGFLLALYESCAEHGFTKERFAEAVKNVIATKSYGTLTVADIVKYDKCFKLYSWYEYRNLVSSGGVANEDFCKFGKLCGCMHYVRVSEMAKLEEPQKAMVRRMIGANRNPDGTWKDE